MCWLGDVGKIACNRTWFVPFVAVIEEMSERVKPPQHVNEMTSGARMLDLRMNKQSN